MQSTMSHKTKRILASAERTIKHCDRILGINHNPPRKPNDAWGFTLEEKDNYVCLLPYNGVFPDIMTARDAEACADWLFRAAEWMEYRNKRLAEKESKHG
jgi:hypothetical protein